MQAVVDELPSRPYLVELSTFSATAAAGVGRDDDMADGVHIKTAQGFHCV